MLIRVKKIGPYEYLYLVENAREDGRHVQRVIKALGRRDAIENADLLDGLIAALVHELADRKPRDGYNREVVRNGIKHPIRNLVETAARLADQEVANPVVLVLPDHQYGLAHLRMKRIGNHGFECQKPGIMPPVRTKVAKTGPAWHL
jgi:hypothetical protein